MATPNISLKNIREFTSDDTIYLRQPLGRGQTHAVLCQFVSFEKGKVTAKSVAPMRHNGEHETFTVKLENCALYGASQGASHNRYHWFDPTGFAAYESPEARHLSVPKTHPSYGVLSICKQSCSGNEALFGSPILHRNVIAIKIAPAELDRSLHEDRIFGRNNGLIEVHVSPQQFADILTSPNSTGTPVTIRQVNGESVEPCPFVSKLEQFDVELDNKIKATHHETNQAIKTSCAMIEESKLPKKDKEHIIRALQSINQQVESNLPFLQSQLAEEMTKIVGEGKAAISQYLAQEARAMGLPVPTMPLALDGKD